MTAVPVFFNLYRHNFARVAVAVPKVRVADPAFNARETIALMREADTRHALVTLFPELGLSAYACDDLFQQRALLDGCLAALAEIVDASRSLSTIALVGLPLSLDGLLFNCAAVVHRGRILGLVPKSYLPNYREFYEARQFSPACYLKRDSVDLLGQTAVPCSTELLFRVEGQPLFTFHVEICEDLWVPIPPSSFGALAGATVLLNLSASNVTVGKADYRRLLASAQSSRCLAAYAYSAAGYGESTTDLAWDGHGMIYENGNALAETQRFADASQLICADLDLDRLADERMRQTTFGDTAFQHAEACARYRTIDVPATVPCDIALPLERSYERFPYVPADPKRRGERCREIYDIQVQGLVTRMRSARANRLVIGVSGGLDSTLALLVCVRAVDMLKLPRDAVVACIMPGFGTGERTLDQARRLVSSLGCRTHEIDIRPSCMQMMRDIGHPFAQGEPVHDVTFENVQAGERTSHLFRMANMVGGLVVGTGDLSELALGWCTYGVGDHMSHYSVNASVPKTLIQYLIRWTADEGSLGQHAAAVLRDVLETDISPELIPPGEDGAMQLTEAAVGPYELQDFNLYYLLRFGYRPSKVAFLAWSAWHDRARGPWPDLPDEKRHAYGIAEIKRWLAVFLRRFFEQQQFKRSCLPNAPKVGSGGSLSPRGDYRAPSDASAAVWLADLESVPEHDTEAP
ncbi:NAD(+) synthase [Trinickia caryophylli]|uniref:Glutamine-dependent NAD(+) synthetase n=1 Tax=Trinickia caryophylli TaxID=28094 RepID=A0A1X7D119_TRICW|nr:NAD(+) synthase [Trinickia caryophylli]PMS13568.1 NAD(+) synthase [Trinickia caryophylli]TRX15264.1 NAD(+) synthase [Trinickia caryophylli]WQE15140.1 NAD(+) synthase [Trinickia caryophylli]SMF06752.1 NAD+ synthase (glutamine-hydrolysing) [Trinickia caryophylli]GLU31123.1 NAD(+) synthase [Trinickia caryophylli]